MKMLAACTVALACLMTATTASAQQSQVRIAPTPGVVPPPAQASYFLGVYTSKVWLPNTGQPIGPLAATASRVSTFIAPPNQPSPQRYGLRVNQVVPGSPAARIGLEPGDILVSGNYQPISCKRDLLRVLGSSGGQLQLTVINVRNGQPTQLVAYPEYRGPVAYSARR
ncbi:MAG: PDZ domain-containing protein [Planctomycetota bacterium]